jgi:DNA-binding NarL/FixJ family response regulator
MTIRVGIVDDHPIALSGLDAALATIPGMDVVGHAGSIAAARHLVAVAAVDVLLLDIRLPDGNGLELLSELGSMSRPAVIIISSFDLNQYVAAAVRFGARGFVLKTAPLERLIEAIRRVADGESAFSAEQLREARTGFVSLTPRERAVLRLVLSGCSNDEIAAKLQIVTKTVEVHLSRLYARFGAMSRTELALRADREGWLHLGGAG